MDTDHQRLWYAYPVVNYKIYSVNDNEPRGFV